MGRRRVVVTVAAIDREMVAYALKHRAKLEQLAPATQARVLAQRRQQLEKAAALELLPPAEKAEALARSRRAIAAGRAMARNAMRGLMGGR